MSTEVKKIYSLDIQGADSVEDLRKAIEQLNEKLKTLNDTSKEYKDTLKQITEYQEKLADAMNVLSNSVDSASTFVEEFTQGFVEGMMEASQSSDEFQDSVMEDASSVGELRSQIKELQDRLVKLDSTTDSYKHTVEVLTAKNQKLQEVMAATKTQVTAQVGSYNALSQELSALRKQWKATSDEAERARIGEKMRDINQQLKDMDASIGNFQRNVGNYTNSMTNVFGNPKKEIRELREQLAHLVVGSEEYNQVLLKMADLTQQQKHFQDQLRFSSANLEDIFSNMTGVARGVAGGFSAINAAMGLMGNQNEDVQKAMLKTQQLMALVQGLTGLQGLGDRIRGLIDGIKGFTSRIGLLNTGTKEFNDTTKVTATEAERATGALDSQAGAATRLANAMVLLNKEEKDAVTVLTDDIAKREAEIATLEKEVIQLQSVQQEKTLLRTITTEEFESLSEEIAKRQELIEKYQEEVESKQRGIDNIVNESRERQLLTGEIDAETVALMRNVETLTKDQDTRVRMLQTRKEELQTYKNLVTHLENVKQKNGELRIEEETLLQMVNSKIEATERDITVLEEQIAENNKLIASEQQVLSKKIELISKQKQLDAEYSKLNKFQLLAIANNRLEAAETRNLIAAERADAAQKKGLAVAYTTLAGAAKIATVAVKGVKAALISSGIGLIIVGIGELISYLWEGIQSLGDWISGVDEAREQLDQYNASVERGLEGVERLNKMWKSQGMNTFEMARKEWNELRQVAVDALFAYQQAFITFGEEAEETTEAFEQWEEVQKRIRDSINDTLDSIESMLTEIEKTERQKGMTQLEKDIDDINKNFEESIYYVQMLRKEGKLTALVADDLINRLNADWELALKQAEEKANQKPTGPKSNPEKDEAERIYKDTVEFYKKEEQKLKEKYENEKALLEKYHKDTTLLTRKYNDDMYELFLERLRAEDDAWKTHLDNMLKLETTGTEEYMRHQIENLKAIFSSEFGAGWENPFETFFTDEILENGGRALSITDDIKETMEMMGLDPHSIDDIQKMIDKWNLDRKAIADAEKALAKFISSQRMLQAETSATKMGNELEQQLEAINLQYEEIESTSAKIFGREFGFYSGLSPEKVAQQMEERYAAMFTEVNQEIELWQKAAEDEKLTEEDKAKAIQKYEEALRKKQILTAQKTIDANNLIIKSYQRVTDALSSMASNLASIFGSVSDMILSNAEAQREAGKISQEEYEKQFEQAKAYQTAQAIINTIAGAVAAFMGITADTGGWGIAAAAIEAAAVLAAGFAQVAQIQSTQPSKGGSSGGSGGANAFSLPQVMVSEPEYQQNLTNQSDIDALGNALGRSIGDQRVYVVENDISEAQNKSRKVDVETTF